MAPFLMNAISVGSVEKISEFINIKQPPKVISQNPAPGTPVIQGMTIELKTVSFSDVPYGVVDAHAPTAVLNVSMADIQSVVESDALLKNAVKTGTIPAGDTDAVVQKLNTALATKGLSGTLKAGDAAAFVKSVNSVGFVNA